MSLTHRQTWSTASFARDTTIFALGRLAEVVLQRAMTQSIVQERYREWLDNLPPPGAEEPRGPSLVTTGASGSAVTLYARPRDCQFYMECEHEHFRALVVVGADRPNFDLHGVFVASFDGDDATASAFAVALARRVADPNVADTGTPCGMPE